MQKLKNLSLKSGSVLVYSLIILAMMLLIAVGMSFVAVSEKKNASSTDASAQAYQTADSAVQQFIYKINSNPSAAISAFSTCNAGIITGPSIGGGTYVIKVYSDSAGTSQITDCSKSFSTIQDIKSTGVYNTTSRAVNVTVSANSSTGNIFSMCGGVFSRVSITNSSNETSYPSFPKPDVLLVDSKDNIIYTVNQSTKTVSMFNYHPATGTIDIPASKTISSTIAIGDMTLDYNNGYMYFVGNSSGGVTKIYSLKSDLSSAPLLAKTLTSPEIIYRGLAFDGLHNAVFFSDYSDSSNPDSLRAASFSTNSSGTVGAISYSPNISTWGISSDEDETKIAVDGINNLVYIVAPNGFNGGLGSILRFKSGFGGTAFGDKPQLYGLGSVVGESRILLYSGNIFTDDPVGNSIDYFPASQTFNSMGSYDWVNVTNSPVSTICPGGSEFGIY
jgi:Tfp pilus assembly protein PilX